MRVSLSLLLLVTTSCMYAANPAADAEKKEWERLYQIFEKNRIRETEEEHWQRELKENPMMEKSEEIKKAFMRAEVNKYSKTEMEDRIKKAREVFDAQGMRICTEVMRYFDITIERTFHEDAQDDLARLAFEGFKEYERTEGHGWSVDCAWKDNASGTRSLKCSVKVRPKELMALYDETPQSDGNGQQS